MDDLQFMGRALALARKAECNGEVPVGAVVVLDDTIVGEGFNSSISTNDPTAHAECVALRNASKRLGNYRIVGTTLYVTLEPCLMCVGALVHARVMRLVFGTKEPKSGAITSNMSALDLPHLNHRVEVSGGVMELECREVLQKFFENRRKVASLA